MNSPRVDSIAWFIMFLGWCSEWAMMLGGRQHRDFSFYFTDAVTPTRDFVSRCDEGKLSENFPAGKLLFPPSSWNLDSTGWNDSITPELHAALKFDEDQSELERWHTTWNLEQTSKLRQNSDIVVEVVCRTRLNAILKIHGIPQASVFLLFNIPSILIFSRRSGVVLVFFHDFSLSASDGSSISTIPQTLK